MTRKKKGITSSTSIGKKGGKERKKGPYPSLNEGGGRGRELSFSRKITVVLSFTETGEKRRKEENIDIWKEKERIGFRSNRILRGKRISPPRKGRIRT